MSRLQEQIMRERGDLEEYQMLQLRLPKSLVKTLSLMAVEMETSKTKLSEALIRLSLESHIESELQTRL